MWFRSSGRVKKIRGRIERKKFFRRFEFIAGWHLRNKSETMDDCTVKKDVNF